jgi:CRP-like cAMP-binding protein
MPSALDPRWVVISENGLISTVSRLREPLEREIVALEIELAKLGMAGWLAIMSHSQYSSTEPQLMEVRVLGRPKVPFEEAVSASRTRGGS